MSRSHHGTPLIVGFLTSPVPSSSMVSDLPLSGSLPRRNLLGHPYLLRLGLVQETSLSPYSSREDSWTMVVPYSSVSGVFSRKFPSAYLYVDLSVTLYSPCYRFRLMISRGSTISGTFFVRSIKRIR